MSWLFLFCAVIFGEWVVEGEEGLDGDMVLIGGGLMGWVC